MDCKTAEPINMDFTETGFFSKLVSDYLENAPSLQPFYHYRPEVESFSEIIRAKNAEGDRSEARKVLAAALHDQYKPETLAPELRSPELERTIDSLVSPDTFTVTTGHQLNIFGGPLYFVYKIMATINLAEAVEKANPGKRIVPVFWMATEDHDFDEINHTYLFGKELKWERESGGAAGRINLDGMNGVLEQLKDILGKTSEAETIAALFEEAYSKHGNLAGATRYFVHRLLGKYGLLIVDGDDPRLKALFADTIKKDILEGISNREVNATDQRLEEAGFKSQAHSREINFFYLDDDLRERIVEEDDQYQVLNTDIRFTKEELTREIDRHPEKFSPNVIMRPLYQERILPNLAYIGGGGELAYWMQLQAAFEAHNIHFPALILRNSVLLIDGKSREKLDTLGVAPEDLFQPAEQLAGRFVKDHSEQEITLDTEKSAFEAVFEMLAEKAFAVDPTLKDSAEAEKARFFNSLKGLENKLAKAGKRRFETELSQLTRIQEKLFPGAGLQERHESFMSFYLKCGPAFFDMLKDNLTPCLNKFQILTVR